MGGTVPGSGGSRWSRGTRPVLLLALTLVGCALVGSSAARAATITVNTFADPPLVGTYCDGSATCSLRQAIAHAASGDEISLDRGVYQVTQGAPLLIDKDLTITGAGGSATAIDGSLNRDAGNDLNRIMKIASGAVSITGLTFTGGGDGKDENFGGGATPTVNLNGGGAIFNESGSLALSDVAFVGNNGNTPIGGAVATTGPSLAMVNVTFSGNAAGVAGALRVRGGAVTGTGVTFDANNGAFGGGSVYIDGGSLTLSNSTIDGSAGQNGFGIGVHNARGTVTLTNVTIAHSQGYALETDVGATTSIQNTLIGLGGRGDCVPSGRNDSVTDSTTGPAVTHDNGNNLDENNDCSLQVSTLSGDPMLAPLAGNGGPTKTDALLHGSPAIDAGNPLACPASDQRGATRIGPCDIGAYEAQLVGQPTATAGEATASSSGGSSSATLRADINLRGEGGAFFFQWGPALDLGSSTPLVGAGNPSEQTTVSEELSGLLPGRTYSFRAVAENASGSTTSENTSSFTTPADQPSVTGVQQSAGDDTSATIDFTIDPNGDSTQYFVEWGTTPDFGNETDTVDIGTTAGAQQRSVTLTGLDAGTTYFARVVARNGFGETDVDTQFSTSATAAPEDVYVDAAWSDVSDGDPVTGPQGQPLTFGTDAFATIGNAVEAVNSSADSGATNTTIHVAAGDYSEEGPLFLQEQGERLIGAGRDVTHVDLPQLALAAAEQVVDGFDLAGPGSWDGVNVCQGCNAPVVSLEGDSSDSSEHDVPQHAIVRNNRISGGIQGVSLNRSELADFPAGGSEVSGNEILHNISGVYVDGGSNNLIAGNDIHDNGGSSGPQALGPDRGRVQHASERKRRQRQYDRSLRQPRHQRPHLGQHDQRQHDHGQRHELPAVRGVLRDRDHRGPGQRKRQRRVGKHDHRQCLCGYQDRHLRRRQHDPRQHDRRHTQRRGRQLGRRGCRRRRDPDHERRCDEHDDHRQHAARQQRLGDPAGRLRGQLGRQRREPKRHQRQCGRWCREQRRRRVPCDRELVGLLRRSVRSRARPRRRREHERDLRPVPHHVVPRRRRVPEHTAAADGPHDVRVGV